METKVKSTSRSKTKTKSKTKTRSKLRLTLRFKEHSKVVERLNELNLGWKADNYEQFSNLTLEQLNKFSGRANSRIGLEKNSITKDNEQESVFENVYALKHKKLSSKMRRMMIKKTSPETIIENRKEFSRMQEETR